MRIQNRHAHAYTRYDKHTNWKHYIYLFVSVIECKIRSCKSLTAHLPFEIQHWQLFGPKENGYKFIYFGERLKKLFNIKLYWENAPLLDTSTWGLKNENTSWVFIPYDIDITLDTGHAMLGGNSKESAQKSIRFILQGRGKQIKHIHLHENNGKRDSHGPIGVVIDEALKKELIKGRTYIYER